MLDDIERWINHANAAGGGIVFWPDDWRNKIDPLVEAFDNNDFGRELCYDSDPVARRIAGHMVKEHIKLWDIVKRRVVLKHWCPEHDESRPETVASLYALCYGEIGGSAYAMQGMAQLKEVTQELLGEEPECQARVNRRCSRNNATKFLAVKRGEYICLFRLCGVCLQHIHSGAGFNDDYIGLDHDWFDDREAEPRDDLWAP